MEQQTSHNNGTTKKTTPEMKKIHFLTLLSLLFISFGNAQKKNNLVFSSIAKEKLPKEIVFEGKIKDLIQWQDKDGLHIVVTTETGLHTSKKFKHESDGTDAELFAYHYRFNKTENKYKQSWKVYDYISDCPVDIEASFIKDTFQVTDLNNNGIAEIWLMYKKTCHGDVSPCEMKIIMYEGSQKHAMRGENKVRISETEFIGGSYTFDNAFLKSDKKLRDFAENLWNKNISQKWGE